MYIFLHVFEFLYKLGFWRVYRHSQRECYTPITPPSQIYFSESDSFVDGDAVDIYLVEENYWVIVKYDEKRYVGRVKDTINGKVKVRCLKEDYGSKLDMTNYERENDAVLYNAVGRPKLIPQLVKDGEEVSLEV